jgi:hypothetical protein
VERGGRRPEVVTTRGSPPAPAALPPARGGGLSSSPAGYRPRTFAISLFLDIGQGAGLAGASGVRPYLPPLLAGALARADAGIDFDGSSFHFLESPGFLLAVFALAIVSYGAERSLANQQPAEGSGSPDRGRVVALALGIAGLILGALLFAGSLAADDQTSWPGLIGGALCAGLAWAALGALFDRARGRVQGSAAGLLSVYADLAALALAAVAIFVEPVAYLAIAAFVVLVVRGRRDGERKYAGLRILR